jgi:hypothetical protein
MIRARGHRDPVRPPKTLKVSPAIAAGVTDRLWEVTDIVEMLEQGNWRTSSRNINSWSDNTPSGRAHSVSVMWRGGEVDTKKRRLMRCNGSRRNHRDGWQLVQNRSCQFTLLITINLYPYSCWRRRPQSNNAEYALSNVHENHHPAFMVEARPATRHVSPINECNRFCFTWSQVKRTAFIARFLAPRQQYHGKRRRINGLPSNDPRTLNFYKAITKMLCAIILNFYIEAAILRIPVQFS